MLFLIFFDALHRTRPLFLWVFFIFFGGDGTHRAGQGGCYMPRRCTPAPQRTRTDCTEQTAEQGTHARTLDTLHRSALDTRQATPGDLDGGGARERGNSSIMRIVIALSQAWYIDSNMNKYHKDILLFLVIVNYYLSIDI